MTLQPEFCLSLLFKCKLNMFYRLFVLGILARRLSWGVMMFADKREDGDEDDALTRIEVTQAMIEVGLWELEGGSEAPEELLRRIYQAMELAKFGRMQ
jgi:hypothetical protein